MTDAPRPAALLTRRAVTGRFALAAVVAVVGLTLVLTIGVTPPAESSHRAEAAAKTAQAARAAAARPKPNAKVPARGVAAPVDRPNASDADELLAWSKRVATATGMQARAARGYGLAEMWMRVEAPDCGLSWSTLAGIGQVASGHGERRGGGMDADGKLATPVVAADDRLGPLLMPLQKWTAHRFRASKDGQRPDPQQIDDAAVSVARELCAGDGDLSGPRGWWSAVKAHGGSTRFAQDAFTAADGYARASAPAGR